MPREKRPADYPRLDYYEPSLFMLDTSHYDKESRPVPLGLSRTLPYKGQVGWKAFLAAAVAGADYQGHLWNKSLLAYG